MPRSSSTSWTTQADTTQSLSLHRILGVAQYRAGSLVLAPQRPCRARSKTRLLDGRAPTQVLPVELWAREYEEIDVFNWQEAVSGMLSASDLEVELAASEGRVSRRPLNGASIVPDHTLTLGERTYYYFVPERTEEIRQTLGLPRVDDASIRELFLEFVARMDMSSSYKPVLLLAMLDKVDERGRARLEDVAQGSTRFISIGLNSGAGRRAGGDADGTSDHLSPDEVRSVMLAMPFRKFEQRKYLSYDREDLAFIRFSGPLASAHGRGSHDDSASTANRPSASTMNASNPELCPFCAMPPTGLLKPASTRSSCSMRIPVSPGHSLVISRRHVADIFDLTVDEIARSSQLIRSARERIDRMLQPTGYNVGVNVGRDAGQTVMHVHVHVIPRYPGDVAEPAGGVRAVIPGKCQYP